VGLIKIAKNIVLNIKNLALNDPKAWNPSLWNLHGSQSLSGEVVTEETALTYSAVWNAINLISGTVGSLPLHLMQSNGKNKRIADNDPLYYVMHDKPNPFMASMVFRRTMAGHVVSWGNAYAEIVRNGLGEVTRLWPIPPNRVLNIGARDDGNLWYEIRVGNENVWLPREKILHILGPSFDGFIGYSVIAMARKGIGLGMAMETFGSKYFGDGIHPSGIVTHPHQLKTPKAMRTALSEVYAGLGNSQRLMLLEDGMKFEQISINPEDSQFLESRQFQIPEIARWFNLPPHKLKDLTKSSFNNIEAEQTSFVMDSILPWLILIEQQYNAQLLTESQQRVGKLYFKHIVEGLLRANSADRAAYYKAMIGTGVMTPNEARTKEDMNPSKDPLADELWMPTGNIPLSKFSEYLSKNQGKPGQPQLPAPGEAKLNRFGYPISNKKKDKVDWKKLYKEGKAHWADDMQPSKFAQDFTQEIIEKGKKSILEIGCGGGRDSILFAIAGLTVTAIDIVPEAIEIAKENAKNADVEIDFNVGSAEKLDFSDKSFGAVFTLSVLHSTNMDKSIPEVFRVLKKNGLAFIYIYSNVEKIDGTEKEFIGVNEYIDLIKKYGFKFLDLYTTPEDEFDEAGEKHLLIVSKVEK